jgi:hypothetical protein
VKYIFGKDTKWAGDVYEGDFKNNDKEGKGVYTWSKEGPDAGEVYDGEWKNGKQHGIAIYTFPSEKIIKGEWEDGVFKRVIEVLQEPRKVQILIQLINLLF